MVKMESKEAAQEGCGERSAKRSLGLMSDDAQSSGSSKKRRKQAEWVIQVHRIYGDHKVMPDCVPLLLKPPPEELRLNLHSGGGFANTDGQQQQEEGLQLNLHPGGGRGENIGQHQYEDLQLKLRPCVDCGHNIGRHQPVEALQLNLRSGGGWGDDDDQRQQECLQLNLRPGGGWCINEQQRLKQQQQQEDQEIGCVLSLLALASPSPSTSPSPLKEKMDPALWCTLPDHLLDSILSRVPMQSFFRFRRVCKSWNMYMHSRSFLEACAEAPSQSPWFLFFTHDERSLVSAYDSALSKWHRLPLSAPHSNKNLFAAADGGLVAYFSSENGIQSVVVCNPLTKSYRRLVPLHQMPWKVTMLAMVVDRVTKAYKVMVSGVSKFYRFAPQVYDSTAESWSSTGHIPTLLPLRGKPVYSQGVLYARTHSDVLVAYDMKQGAWSRPLAPWPYSVGHGELLEWEGRILMVGELEEHRKIQTICIWEHQMGSLKWKEVDRLPADLFEAFFGDKDYFQNNERDDVILDWCQAGRFVLMLTYNLYDVRGRCKQLMYDLSKKSWQQKLQSYSRDDVCGTGRIVRGIFHEPRLDISP